MKTVDNSISQNGCSVCMAGEENYTTFCPIHRSKTVFYQYDYRHTDNELFSTVAPTLEACREKRDKWLLSQNYKRLLPGILQKIQDGKRLTKSEMAYQIGRIEPYHSIVVSWDFFSRDEIVSTFNRFFGTEVK
jgi:hypothetical protein